MSSSSFSNPSSVYVSSLAYTRLLSHALKHPTSSVVGVLIGCNNTESNSVRCLDVLPLLHTHINSATMLGLGFNISEKIALGRKQEVIGVYMSNGNGSSKPSSLLESLAVKVMKVLKGGTVLMVDTEGLTSSACCLTALSCSSKDSPSLSPSPSTSVTLHLEAIPTLEKALEDWTYLTVSDLDDHCSDPKTSDPMKDRLGVVRED